VQRDRLRRDLRERGKVCGCEDRRECRELGTVAADAFHCDHGIVELAIRNLKQGAGLEHCPSGRFYANAAWLGCAVLAHNRRRSRR
jgi:hypothetical protein